MKIQKIAILVLIVLTVISPNSYSREDEYKDYTDIGKIDWPVVPVEEIFNERDKYNREIITIKGKLSEIDFKNLVGGKKFTLFIVEDPNGMKVNVYARGNVDGLKEGSDIKVHGRYSASKKFMFKKYRNVLKAKKIQVNTP